jgi:RimJ/RimL family protein N-acetyltransferase
MGAIARSKMLAGSSREPAHELLLGSRLQTNRDRSTGLIPVIGEAILRIENAWHGRGEIGWGVDAQSTGRGRGTEIDRAIVNLGFKLGLHRLHAQCRVGNAASRRTMAKVGMTEGGIIRENIKARGEWWSSCQSSILRGDLERT